ncbi:MAG: CPBP family intramembrane metalloprotease [Opitutae bacterium]|nr:CPBP family intramembrane metalloprotease [Opitutae bacterium]
MTQPPFGATGHGPRSGHAAVRAPTESPALPQYSLRKILGIWAAAALPMPVLAFGVSPHLSAALGLHPGVVLWGLMIAGMMWQFVLSCLLLRAESATLGPGRWRTRLWLRTPRDPANGRPRLALLWWVVPVAVGTFLIEETRVAQWLAAPLTWLAPSLAAVPEPRLESLADPRFIGAWWLVAMGLLSCVFNYALGEELLFRSVLLPRMRGVFGRWDWLANAVLFATYHLIRPLTIPTIIVSTMLWTYPTRRFRSVWFAVIPHAIEGVVVMTLIVGYVGGFITP